MFAFSRLLVCAFLASAATLLGATPGHAQYRYNTGPYWHDAWPPPAARIVNPRSRQAARQLRAPGVAAVIPLPVPRPAVPVAAEPAPAGDETGALARWLPRGAVSPRVGSPEWQAEQAAMAQEDARVRQIINSICRGC